MQSIKALSDQRILEILQETHHLADWLCRRNPFIQVDSGTSNSLRTSLHSNDNDLETSGHHGMTVSILMSFELNFIVFAGLPMMPKTSISAHALLRLELRLTGPSTMLTIPIGAHMLLRRTGAFQCIIYWERYLFTSHK